MGKDGKAVTPEGGFVNYGILRNDYVIIKGSIPGPVKRLVRMRPAIRPKNQSQGQAPEISYISLESKQG
jgi:large subunit ribosomal protein L3